jgi:hypothetical protein
VTLTLVLASGSTTFSDAINRHLQRAIWRRWREPE